MIIQTGIPQSQRGTAAALYWQAFGPKLRRVLGPDRKALAFVNRVLDTSHGIAALDGSGVLLGVAGFKTPMGALVGGNYSDMKAIYGALGGSWRWTALAHLGRDIENRRFLVDGLFVCPKARGRGVGTALLSALEEEARARGYRQIRLDVIDSNTRARALYERQGFRTLATRRPGMLERGFGFSASIAMVRTL